MKRQPEHIFDELLVLRCQEHDQKAFALLWNRWQPRILKWSFDLIGDHELADEVAQESWVSIYKGMEKLKDPALFRFWAYRIVQRRSADWIRKEQRKRASLAEVEHDGPPIAASDMADNSEDTVSTMLKAIKELPEGHQQMLRLFYMEKMPVKLLAKTLGLPEGTVKSRLYYAREQLKKKLKENNHG